MTTNENIRIHQLEDRISGSLQQQTTQNNIYLCKVVNVKNIFLKYHPWPLTASSSTRLGVHNLTPKPKTPIVIMSGMGEANGWTGKNIFL